MLGGALYEMGDLPNALNVEEGILQAEELKVTASHDVLLVVVVNWRMVVQMSALSGMCS